MFATSVTRPSHDPLGSAHILTVAPRYCLADFFRCKEAAQLRRVAADFAFNSLLKDKVSPEAREAELEKFVAGLERQIVAGLKRAGHPAPLDCPRCKALFATVGLRIKDKTIDEAEACLKHMAKTLGGHLPETTSSCSFACVAVAFLNPNRGLCVCGRKKRRLTE